MEFRLKYEEYMQGEKQLPGVGFKKLKVILKKCKKDTESEHDGTPVYKSCPECDHVFTSLLEEMSASVDCFNNRAQKLLDLHLDSGLGEYFEWFTRKLRRNRSAVIEERQDLVKVALINAIAVRKVLKKFDKICYCNKGQAFKSQNKGMQVDVLHSPWLCELMAFQINLGEAKRKAEEAPSFLEGCSLRSDDDGKPSLSWELFDSINLDIDLTCPICLDTVFDPVALSCGHIFCHMCACSAASVSIIDGLKAAEPDAKCPLCRQSGVFKGALKMRELNILLSRSYSEYWKQRRSSERAERLRQAKEYWDFQSRAFVGV